MSRYSILLFVLFTSATTTATAQLVVPEIQPPAQKGEDKLSATEQKLLDLANAERKKAGVPPLRPAPLAMKAARGHSANMAKQGELNHDLDGKGPAERLTDVGYQWSAVGENIALGQRTPAEAIQSWMNSEGHRTNLLSDKYTDAGIGIFKGTNGKLYWTMVYAKDRFNPK